MTAAPGRPRRSEFNGSSPFSLTPDSAEAAAAYCPSIMALAGCRLTAASGRMRRKPELESGLGGAGPDSSESPSTSIIPRDCGGRTRDSEPEKPASGPATARSDGLWVAGAPAVSEATRRP